MDASIPWQLGEWDLIPDLVKIEQQWASLGDILEDPRLFDRREPDVSDWSCGQHAGHSILVAQTIAVRIEGNLADPDRHRDEAAPEVAHRVLSAGRFPRGSATSPADVHPASRPREDFLPLLPSVMESWQGIQARADELPGCVARYPHPNLGYLTSTEWVRMCAVHTAHHLSLIHDIAGESGA